MLMEQAKWYDVYYEWNVILPSRSLLLYYNTLIYLLETDHRIKKIGYSQLEFKFSIFCGKKKLNKIIEEAHLLGLEDELLIFERR